MYKDLDSYIKSDDSAILDTDGKGQATSHELQVATVSILVSAAKINGEITCGELGRMTSSLFVEFGTSDEENGDLLALAQILLQKPNKLDCLLNSINQNFSVEQKMHILSLTWRVLVADHILDSKEAEFAVELRKKLGLSMEQAVLAQQQASRHSNINPLS